MKHLPHLLLVCVSAAAFAARVPEWEMSFKPFSGKYSLYGGNIGDPIAPTSHNKKISFEVKEGLAKEIFNSIGPDLNGACGAIGIRIRQKDGISCSYDKETGYMCYFGFDLRTGKSIGGSVC